MAFYYYFLNPEKELDEYNGLGEEYPKNRVFYKVNDLQEYVQNSVKKYNNIEEDDDQMLISQVTLTDGKFDKNLGPSLWPKYVSDAFKYEGVIDTSVLRYNLTETDFGPFNETDTIK